MVVSGGRAHSTGLAGLDSVLKGLLPGDNIVWQVDSIEDYRRFVAPLLRGSARERGRTLIYFRFASHPPLVGRGSGAEIHELRPAEGFETVHRQDPQRDRAGRARRLLRLRLPVRAGRRLVQRPDAGQLLHAHLPLPVRPGDDRLLRPAAQPPLVPRHRARSPRPRRSSWTSTATTGELYVHPLKVQHRYSPTMYMLHAWEGRASSARDRQRRASPRS